jgi:hypothetical protein
MWTSAQHDFLCTRGWMQMVFYCHMIYSPETDRQIKHCSWLQLLRIQQVNAHNDTYSVHKGALVPCRPRPCLLSSWECLTISVVRYQLLTSSPSRRAGPPFSPSIQDGPISPRVHAHLCPLVCYSTVPYSTVYFYAYLYWWYTFLCCFRFSSLPFSSTVVDSSYMLML